VTMALSVLSLDCSPDTVESSMDSGVSMASKSSTLSEEAAGSSEDWTSSAFAWASVTFASASSMNFLRTSCKTTSYQLTYSSRCLCEFAYLNGANVCVLCRVLILVKSIFCQFALLQIDTELDKLYHDRFKRRDRTVPRSLRRDMFV